MARPTVPAVTEYWYGELAVSQPADEQLGWPFLIFLAGLGVAFGPLHDIVRDTPDGPGWSSILDPARAPVFALPWTAQFAGVHLTPGASEAQQRAEITSPNAFERGSLKALELTAQRRLTGGRKVTILERDGSPWRTTVITYANETPDPAATERDVIAQELGGERITYVLAAGELWGEATSTWDTAPAATWDDTRDTTTV